MNKLSRLGAALALAVSAAAPAFAAELTFWSWRQEDRAAYQEIIADFNKLHPDVKIKFEAFEPTSYNTILSTALAGGKGPDLIQARAYGGLEAFAKPGYFLALDKATVPELDNFAPDVLAAETMREDGKVYAVPFATQTVLILYNKEIFQKNGVNPPENWDDMIAAAKALKAKGVMPFANGTATAWQNEILMGAFTPSIYGPAFNSDLVAGKATFEDKRFVDALGKLVELKEHLPQGFTGVDYPTMQQLFISGRAAMIAAGSFEIANFRKQNPKLEIGVIPGPAAAKGGPRLVSLFVDGGYAINAKTEHKADAIKFIRYVATPRFGELFSARLGNISPIKGVKIEDGLLADVAKLNASSAPYVMLVNFRYQEPTGSMLIQSGVQKMMAGQATPAEVGSEVTKGIAAYHKPFQK
ncbi:MAG: extracellular solute-binding protein [Alphaproteobacteria bacterium]|nr:extracellular solute-binding protein [Alphaproteobacteria bacterium]